MPPRDPPPAPLAIALQLEAIEATLRQLAQGHAQLLREFEEKIKFDAVKQVQFDRLHEERIEYRRDLLGKVQLPILKDVIGLHDSLLDFAAAWAAQPPEKRDWDRLLENLRALADGVVDVLERHGVTPYREEGEVFNPRTQRSAKEEVTHDPAADRTIAIRHRPGFLWHGQALRSEVVVIRRFSPSAAPSPGRETLSEAPLEP